MLHQIALYTMSGVVVYFFKYNMRSEDSFP
jgi:hypothetical protein